MKVSAVFFINAAYSITWVGGFPIAHEQQHTDLVDGVVGRSDIGNQANRIQSMSDFDQNARAEHYISEDVLGADRFLKIASKGPKTKGKSRGKSRGKSSNEVDFIPTVHVVTHATEDIDLFWSTWKEGAEAALDKHAYLKWDAVGYNSTHASEALEKACTSSDAIVVTVPYAEGTEDYDKMDEAINKCIFEHQKPVFTTNTDTYHNDDVFAYFGSSNYDMGVKCALSILFPTDNNVISGRKALPGKDETNHTMDIQIYWDAASKLDEGLRQRFEGLTTTLKIYKEDDKVVPFLPTGRPSCPCVVDRYPDGVPTDADEGLRVTIDGKIYDYPPKYGLETCSRHDKNMIPSCSGSNPPEFCDKTWCYVDPENCDSVEASTEGQYVWTDYAGQEYPYSYETCGSRNLYLDFIGGSNSDGDAGDGTVIGDDKQTIVLSSNWAPNFNSGNQSVFICGDETFLMPHVPQYGQSPWLQGMSSVSAAATAARGVAKRTEWKAFKGNSAASSSSNSYNGPRRFGSFTICLKNKADSKNVKGAIVQCLDNDNNGFGRSYEKIGEEGETGVNGCYTASYITSRRWDWAWGDKKNPDIYCRVRYNGKQWLTPEKTNHNGNHFVETLVEDIPDPYEATVCVESASFNNEPVSGAHVQCWDNYLWYTWRRAPIGNKGMTGGNGCYTTSFLRNFYRLPKVSCEVNYLGQKWETSLDNTPRQKFKFTMSLGSFTICLKNKATSMNVEGAIVQCWDNDNNGFGQEIGTKGETSVDGCYTAYYITSGVSWDLAMIKWAVGNSANPDIYCIVRYNDKQWRTSQRNNHNGNHFVETLVEDIPDPRVL